MSRVPLSGRASFLTLLIAHADSGCQSANYGLLSLSWWHRRDNAFAYAAPNPPAQSAIAAPGGSVPRVASNAASSNPQAKAISSPSPDPYAAGADATMAASSRSDSAESGPRSNDSRSTCASGCCSRCVPPPYRTSRTSCYTLSGKAPESSPTASQIWIHT